MKILGIENRTENWRTAYYFSLFFRGAGIRLDLAKELLARHQGKQPSEVELGQGEVHINLFWKGMRDYFCPDDVKKRKGYYKRAAAHNKKDFARLYNERFPTLPKLAGNYAVSTEEGMSTLFSNLFNTEIDIVLQSPHHLFVGEAKHESGLTGRGKYVLVHQLIRQYVMAKILLAHLGCEKKVIPFVVRDPLKGREQDQVDFMVNQGWMSKKNVLTWDDIKKLTGGC